jgi:glycosyltransferase involved in cell wall biosynthesis
MDVFYSVIIPVFNSEKYLSDCLKSVLNQNHTNYEIIIINDNSTDSSKKILNKFKKKYSKIRILNNKINLGVSASRNKGILKAKGNYIIFLDSDDLLLPNALQGICKKIRDNRSNIIILSHKDIRNKVQKNITIKNSEKKGIFKKNKYTDEKPLNLVKDYSLFNPLCWNFALNRNFLLKKKIFFENIRVHEDHIFVSRLFYTKEKATNSNLITHARRSTSLNSLGRSTGHSVCKSCLQNIYYYMKDYKKNKFNSKELNFFKSRLHFFIKIFILNLFICNKNQLTDLSKYITKNLHSIYFKLVKLNLFINFFAQNKSNYKKLPDLKSHYLSIINKNYKFLENKKINIVCASSYSKICINIFSDLFKTKIINIFDNNENFLTEKIYTYKIKSINYKNIHKVKKNYFLICNNNNKDSLNIKSQLINLKVPKINIINFNILKYYNFKK